jgi:hypothetical protein
VRYVARIRENRNLNRFWYGWGNPQDAERLTEPGVDRRIILKWIVYRVDIVTRPTAHTHGAAAVGGNKRQVSDKTTTLYNINPVPRLEVFTAVRRKSRLSEYDAV